MVLWEDSERGLQEDGKVVIVICYISYIQVWGHDRFLATTMPAQHVECRLSAAGLSQRHGWQEYRAGQLASRARYLSLKLAGDMLRRHRRGQKSVMTPYRM